MRITCSILSKSVASSDSGDGLAVSTGFDVGEVKGTWLLRRASMPSCITWGLLVVYGTGGGVTGTEVAGAGLAGNGLAGAEVAGAVFAGNGLAGGVGRPGLARVGDCDWDLESGMFVGDGPLEEEALLSTPVMDPDLPF
jgi:hypothetical protein